MIIIMMVSMLIHSIAVHSTQQTCFKFVSLELTKKPLQHCYVCYIQVYIQVPVSVHTGECCSPAWLHLLLSVLLLNSLINIYPPKQLLDTDAKQCCSCYGH